ncbi:MAG TPA: TolC family protein [Paludibacter sp.]|nr:TolC family protein [Paludibacter sp.]
MKKKIITLVIILLTGQQAFSQENKTTGLSLQQCVQMAVDKNINVKTSRIDKEKSNYKKEESRAALLPKVNISAGFTDNLALPTTVLPGEFLGKPGTTIPVQMGSQYNTTAVVSISQILYNQTALTAVKLTKKAAELSNLSVEKASEEIAFEVAKLYALGQTTAEQYKLISENIKRTERLRDITKIIVENGVGKQVDLDRVNVNLENMYTQQSNTQLAQEQQQNMIKYMLDLPLEQTIVLTDTAAMPLLTNVPMLRSDFSDHVNIRLLESQKELNVLNKKLINNGYLPTLSLSGQAAYQGLRNDFSTYFKSGEVNKWYPMSSVSVNLSVPVFDGFEKRSKSRQATMDLKKTEETIESTKENFSMNYKNALNNYMNNKDIVRRQKLNLTLAEKVYKETALKYREGLAGMSSLLQDEMSLSSAQGGYLTALYNFKEAELKIMTLNGGIKQLYN